MRERVEKEQLALAIKGIFAILLAYKAYKSG